MTDRATRDRPAREPGGMVCDECGEIFIGADWHAYCGLCVEIVSKREATARALANGEEARAKEDGK